MLYFVSTPIGNLGDVSLRALEVLKEVDFIACEDTRTSLKFLNRYGVKKPLVSYHKFNERTAGEKLIEELKAGKNVAVISDAGTPVVSDPGNSLAERLVEEGLEFTVIPGATAFVPALILSGFDAKRFMFVGFLPDKKSEKRNALEELKGVNATLIFYCAPHDLEDTLSLMYSVFGNRRAATVKEITKLHERTERFFLADGIKEEEPRGEYVIVVEGGKTEDPDLSLSVSEHVEKLVAEGLSKMDAVKKVAKARKMPKSEVYKLSL
ncbi:MAG TPA: 16S rRNA (cytidine(1402)-2'-O)-methyltransferase [Clostridiales bacterium]|nr:16S rRNA (cytidine(1402)-2'-O)-methyltransferase [Clostridiales bacterium]